MKAPEIVKALRAMAQVIEDQGMPTEAMMLQTDPREEAQAFVCVWRNSGERRMDAVEVAP